jgi:hypothetical protein
MSNKPNKPTLPQEITGGTLGFLVGELSAAVTHCKVAPCFGLRRRCLSFCFLLQLTASNAFSMCLPLKILHSYCLNYQVCYDASNWGSIRMLLYLELFGSSDTTVALLQDVTTSTFDGTKYLSLRAYRTTFLDEALLLVGWSFLCCNATWLFLDFIYSNARPWRNWWII